MYRFVIISFLVVILGANEPILSLPLTEQPISDKVKLGKKLFFDTRLSKDNTISCATCHPIHMGGMDNLEKSFGVNGVEGDVNSPTVLNSGFNFVQFWDGRVRTLEEQVEGPLHNPKEMATNWPETTEKLRKDQQYKELFQKVYNDEITIDHIKNAIAEYERSLIAPGRFDRFLNGDTKAISKIEQEGYELFKSYGCSSCHQGINVGGNMYEKLGVFTPYFYDRNITKADKGRFNVTNDIVHLHEFKVPSLRNVAKTYPYFHDGSVKTLQEAIKIMAKHQVGQSISDEDIEKIVKFLNTLTWEKLEK
ncbi:cytochrome-c peroxidase [Sulfurimonas gotlandica GD1]|uniref:Cytochrome-c peroxidase n=1 Tax=Sulfurimonas gotlandica (strain DSM 19862 / JCM 16533 / GD1) TaxID=929558 RepID=B6BJ29_SULGG|nr:cytochrome-c peroxidase [Sulfurimonas gotlandica]EDZ63587.1 cytochrome-c peroxidase [Sulfurimonas gotlandica GD1]EHP30544.1 cytochrome-c peroxidase [Sulfurimonas gotlandica GD1]